MPKLLRLTSLACCAFVLASFFLFAVAESHHASQGQTSALSAGTATAAPTAVTHARTAEAQPRRFIDAVARKLDSPFTGIVTSDNAWVRRGMATLFALAVYGFLLGFLARWTAARPA